jgi:hypothetical protein
MKNQGLDQGLAILREKAPGNELDYGFVMDCLKVYKNPRSKLTQLLRDGALIRLKKGIYVFSRPLVRGEYSLETLANIIYGPSYVSLEWALSFYGMIPERVEEITSVTLKRKQSFTTPLGTFSYEHTHPDAYPEGITRMELSDYQKALIATPEKAVCDLLMLRRGKVTSRRELREMMYEDLRMDEEAILKLDRERLAKIESAYPHSSVKHLLAVLHE